MPTTYNWIYLGTTSIRIDPTERNTVAENTAALNGMRFGSSNAPLYDNITSATANDTGGSSDAIDSNNQSRNETITTTVGQTTKDYVFDASSVYTLSVTYADGTTATTSGVVVQMTTGELFLAPPPSGTNAVFSAKPIVSIGLSGGVNGLTAELQASRAVIGFDDGEISGTDGNDLIDGNYNEPIGNGSDRVDNGDGVSGRSNGWNDDVIYAGAGNDTVHSGLGDDLVYGGTGNDRLYGGTGADTLHGDAGNDQLFGGAGADQLFGGAGNDTLSGDGGNDTLTGGAGNDRFIVSGGELITDFGTTGGDNDYLDLTAFYNDTTLAAWNAAHPDQHYNNPLQWLLADQADGILQAADGMRIQKNGTAIAPELLGEANTGVTCFTRGTLLQTARGAVAVEDLQKGDFLLTADHGLQPLLWIGMKEVSAADLRQEPLRYAPIRIAKGALGANMPERDLVLSPQHRVLLKSPILSRMVGETEAFVAAKQLVAHAGISRDLPETGIVYFHLLFARHEVLFAEGAAVESLLLGPEARKSLTAASWAELSRDFAPLLAATVKPARPLLTGKVARKFLERAKKNARALVEGEGRAFAKPTQGQVIPLRRSAWPVATDITDQAA